ncbi:MAG: ABC transporter permease [Planctomycetia bacterium]|jgi:hypothetical protein
MNTSLVIFAIAPYITPLWVVAVGAIATLATLFVLFQILRLLLPKLAAITWATAKEAMTQPLFGILLAIGITALLLFLVIPYFTFGEDLKMVKDTGLTVIMILAIIFSIWTASVSVSEEIDGKTALTVLSKPIKRWHFILGKFFGILLPVAIMFVVLGTVFLSTIPYKVKYDARESSQPEPTMEQYYKELKTIAPGLPMAFMEAAVIASIGVAISTRMPMLPNLIICGAIYALGHLIPLLANSTAGQLEYVPFMANVLAALLPMLEHFNVYGAIATGQEIPWNLVFWAGLYSVVYCTMAMLAALLLFEDRDLA